jgi:hypothetical protein
LRSLDFSLQKRPFADPLIFIFGFRWYTAVLVDTTLETRIVRLLTTLTPELLALGWARVSGGFTKLIITLQST